MKKKTKKITASQKLLIVLIAAFGAALVVVTGMYTVTQATNAFRLQRIQQIYSGLKLDDSYQLTSSKVFGDKRLYPYDHGRSYSSEETFVRGANVSATVADLKNKIINDGFSFYQEPYPGSVYTELIYKSKQGEYIRLTVSSKPRDDAIRNAVLMGQSSNDQIRSMNQDTGPSNITIKVNLDDNNE